MATASRSAAPPDTAAPLTRLASALAALAPVAAVQFTWESDSDVVVRLAYHESQEDAMSHLRERLGRRDVEPLAVRLKVSWTDDPWRRVMDVRVDRSHVESLGNALTAGWLFPVVVSQKGLEELIRVAPTIAAKPRTQVSRGLAAMVLVTAGDLDLLEAELAARPPQEGDVGRLEMCLGTRFGLDQLEEAVRLARRSPLVRA